MSMKVLSPQAIPIESSAPNSSFLGNSLCRKAEGVYKSVQTLCTLFENTANQPARAATAVVSCLSIFSGGMFGVLGLAFGSRELYNLGQKTGDPIEMLQGITADVESIGMLAQDGEKHLNNIQEKLDAIKIDVDGLHASLDAIRSLNKQGLKEIQSHQKTALSWNEKAVSAYAKANQLFTQAQNASREARDLFKKSSDCFAEVLTLANDPKHDVEAIKAKAEQALNFCNNGRAKLNDSDTSYCDAFAAFQEASALKTQSLAEISLATKIAEEIMKSSAEKAKYTDACNRKLESIQTDLSSAQENIKDILELVEDLKEQITEANECIRGKLDASDLLAGVASSLLTQAASAVALSPVVALAPAVAVGMCAGYCSHWSVPQRIYHFFFGEDLGPMPILRNGELFLAEMDQISSGKWGAYVMKRPSKTVGNITLDLGDPAHPSILRFNLNNKSPVSKLDLLKLFLQMAKKIEQKKMSPEHALEILKKLTNPQMIKGIDLDNRSIQILKKDSFFIRRIEALCKKKQVNL